MVGISLAVFVVVSIILGTIIGGAVLQAYARMRGLPVRVETPKAKDLMELLAKLQQTGANIFAPKNYKSGEQARNSGMIVGAVVAAVTAGIAAYLTPIVAHTVSLLVGAGVAYVCGRELLRVGAKLYAGYLPLLERLSSFDWHKVAASFSAENDKPQAPTLAPVGPVASVPGADDNRRSKPVLEEPTFEPTAFEPAFEPFIVRDPATEGPSALEAVAPVGEASLVTEAGTVDGVAEASTFTGEALVVNENAVGACPSVDNTGAENATGSGDGTGS